jgi:DNA-binding NarL/FixJ family response regulator
VSNDDAVPVENQNPAPPITASFGSVRIAWKLTSRQSEVLSLVSRGYTNALIGQTLGIAERTVEFHVTALFDKAGVDNRTTLIARAFAVEKVLEGTA